MQYLFIVNPTAGKGKIQKTLVENIKNYSEKNNLDYNIELTKGPLDATNLAAYYGEKYSEGLKIYSAGGDGTLHEAANGILNLNNHQNISLGVLPIGTGNDFSRNLTEEISKETILDVHSQINGDAFAIDVLKVNINGRSVFGINALTIGWDSEVAIDIVNIKKKTFLSGSGAYFFSILKALSKIKHTRPLTVAIDDGEVIKNNYLLSLCANGCFYGGGFMGAPRAKLDDGLIDLVMVTEVPISKLPNLILNYKNGNHIDPNNTIFHDYLEYRTTKEVHVISDVLLPITIDGEGEYTKELSIEVLHKKLNFIFPRQMS